MASLNFTLGWLYFYENLLTSIEYRYIICYIDGRYCFWQTKSQERMEMRDG